MRGAIEINRYNTIQYLETDFACLRSILPERTGKEACDVETRDSGRQVKDIHDESRNQLSKSSIFYNEVRVIYLLHLLPNTTLIGIYYMLRTTIDSQLDANLILIDWQQLYYYILKYDWITAISS